LLQDFLEYRIFQVEELFFEFPDIVGKVAPGVLGDFVLQGAFGAGDLESFVVQFFRVCRGEASFFNEDVGWVGGFGVDLAIAISFGERLDDIGGAGDKASVVGKFSSARGDFEGSTDDGEIWSKSGDEFEIGVVEDFEGGLAGEVGIAGDELGVGVAERGDFPEAPNNGAPLAVIDLIAEEEAEVGSVDEELVGGGGVFFFEEVGEG
jgi:hypothetical protein